MMHFYKISKYIAQYMARITTTDFRRFIYSIPLIGPYVHNKINKFLSTNLYTQDYQWFAPRLGVRAGLKMRLKLPMENEFFLETHDTDVTKILIDRIKYGFKVVEIGAHIGYFSLLIAKLIGTKGKLFAIEPLPVNQKRLNEHIISNGFNNVKILNFAVSDKNDNEDFFVFDFSTIGRLTTVDPRYEKEPLDKISVECRTFDSLYKTGLIDMPDFIKIDTEGAELLILKGMHDILKISKPQLLIELHNEMTALEVWGILKNYNYIAYRINNHKLNIASMPELAKDPKNILANNFLFI